MGMGEFLGNHEARLERLEDQGSWIGSILGGVDEQVPYSTLGMEFTKQLCH